MARTPECSPRSARSASSPEHDLDDVRDASADPRDDTLDHLAEEGLIRFVDVDADERAAVLTDQGRDVLDAHRRDRHDDRGQEFHTELGRERELQHDAELFHAYLDVERRLRDEGAEIERVVLAVRDELATTLEPSVVDELE